MRRPVAKTLKYVDPPLDDILKSASRGAAPALVLAALGRDIHEVRMPSGALTLASLVPRLRGILWLRRGSIVVYEPNRTDAALPVDDGGKLRVTGEIAHVFSAERLGEVLRGGSIRPEFAEQIAVLVKAADSVDAKTADSVDAKAADGDSSSDDGSSDSSYLVNPNRVGFSQSDSSDDESDTDSFEGSR